MDPDNHVAWPGWTAERTLLLPIPAERWPPPTAPVLLDDIEFQPKSELHVTLVGRAVGQILQGEYGRPGVRTQTVREAFGKVHWHITRTGELLRLEKTELPGRGRGRTIGSIIELVKMPALEEFYSLLSEHLDRDLTAPPPHVTLYTSGRAQGIAVPDQATLDRLTVREVAASELADYTPPASPSPSDRPKYHHR